MIIAPRIRLVALVLATALVAACDGRDPLAPDEVAGTWVRDFPVTADQALPPDTLVLNRVGRGRIKMHVWLDPVTPGGAERPVWAGGPVEYSIQRDDVFVRWCLQTPERPPVTCLFDGYALAGRLRKDGRLWIGPTSMASSLSSMPWKRVSRGVD